MSVVMKDQHEMLAFQKKQLEMFLQRGLPTRKEENWKYTDVSMLSVTPAKTGIQTEIVGLDASCSLPSNAFIGGWHDIVFINGNFSSELSNLKKLPDNITLMPLSQAFELHSETIKKHFSHEFDVKQHPFAVLNSAHAKEGIFLHVPKNSILSSPIKIIYYNNNENVMTSIRNIFILDENAETTVIEEYISKDKNTFTNVVTDIYANNNVKFNHYKIQEEAGAHTGNIFVNQKQDSQINLFNLTKDTSLARNDVTIRLAFTGAECHLLGLYLLDEDNQHIDNHIHVDHAAQQGTSSMLYKGILNKKSRAVFNGKVHVHQNAQGINAYQANHNLLLSKEAEVNTKPELEIYADDVKCAHGATIGQLDNESIFYLCARGIQKEEAVKILLSAFIHEVLSQIKNPEVRHYIEKRVAAYDE